MANIGNNRLALFDWVGLCLSLLLLAWAGWTGHRSLALLSGSLVAASVVSRLWSRWSLWRLHLARSLTAPRVFAGETTELALSLANKKPLPVLRLVVEEELPRGVGVHEGDGEGLVSSESGQSFVLPASFLWYGDVTWRKKLLCERRGWYRIGPAKLRGADPFGLFWREQSLDGSETLIVYPRLLTLSELELLAGRPLGELRRGSPIFEDPSQTIGTRQYRSSDALKRINWRASARARELQSRVYEATTTQQIVLVLDLEGYADPAGGSELFELAVSVVGSLASYSMGQRQPTGLLANGGAEGAKGYLAIESSAEPEDLMRILEELARIQPRPARNLAELLWTENAKLPWGSTLLVVVRSVTEELLAVTAELRLRGRKTLLWSVEAPAAVGQTKREEVGVS